MMAIPTDVAGFLSRIGTAIQRQIHTWRKPPLSMWICEDGQTGHLADGELFDLNKPWQLPKTPRGEIALILSPELYFSRRIAVPGAAAKDIRSLVDLNFTAWTGFRRDEVLSAYRHRRLAPPRADVIDVAAVELDQLDAWALAAAATGHRLASCDLGLGAGFEVHIADPAAEWTVRERSVLLCAFAVWMFGLVFNWQISERETRALEQTIEVARSNISEQVRLRSRLRAAEDNLRRSDADGQQSLAAALFSLSDNLASIAKLEEFLWDQGAATVRLTTADPDAVLTKLREISLPNTIETIGGLEAAQAAGNTAYRMSVRYRTRLPQS